MRVAVLVASITACAAGCAYQPGSFQSFRQQFPGEHVAAGCLDVAIARVDDTATGAVLHWSFANRCDHAATVDLFSIHATGRTRDGVDLQLVAFDPDHALRPLPLDGRVAGAETIEYRTAPSGGDPVASICVDAGELAHVGPPQWRCFGAQRPAITAVMP